MTKYPELISQIETTVTFWEKQVVSKRDKQDEYKQVLYQTRLLLAYFKGDEDELNSLTLPVDNGPLRIGHISNHEQKDFYRALIRMDKSPETSYDIFNNLIKKYPQYTNIALNRMAAKIRMAEKEEYIDYYYEALEEWEEYKNISKNIIDENKLGTTFIANKILIYFKTQQYDAVNRMYSNLNLLYQMDPRILEIYIDTLSLKGESAEALKVRKEAEKYHKLTNSENGNIVKKIKVNENKVIEELKLYYSKIFDSKPEELIKIFPERMNGKSVLNQFITKEFALAADRMLDKIMAISEIKSENKYNDIIELAVDSRISPWGWNVGGQSRGGFSNPRDKSIPKEPGERDLPIMDANKILFCICEAFIYRDKSSAMEHVQKIFNYYHQHQNLIILIYNLTNGKFKDNWNEYTKDIIPHSCFPVGREFESLIDVTNSFGYGNSAIKIAQSIHTNEIVMHHIFVNIDYRSTH